MIATSSPRSTCMVTPRSASTAVSPEPKRRVRSSHPIAEPASPFAEGGSSIAVIGIVPSRVALPRAGPGSMGTAWRTVVPRSLRDRGSADFRCGYDRPREKSRRAEDRVARRAPGGDRRHTAHGGHQKGDRAPRLPRRHRPPGSAGRADRALLARDRPRARALGAPANALDAAHGPRRALARRSTARRSRSIAMGSGSTSPSSAASIASLRDARSCARARRARRCLAPLEAGGRARPRTLPRGVRAPRQRRVRRLAAARPPTSCSREVAVALDRLAACSRARAITDAGDRGRAAAARARPAPRARAPRS